MAPRASIGSRSLAAAGAAVLLAQFFAPMLLAVVQAGETAGWLALLIAGALAAALFWPVGVVLASVPGGTVIDLARQAAGAPAAMATGLLIFLSLTYHSGLLLRETAEMTVSAVYPHTPQTFVIVALAACALYGAAMPITSLVRLGRMFLPALILSLLLVLVGSFGWGQTRYLLPIWGPGPGVLLVRSAKLLWAYLPFLFVLMAAGQLRDRQQMAPAGMVAMGIASIMAAVITVVLLMVFPMPLGATITFPLHHMARLVLGGRFFERTEGIWTLVWVFGLAYHLAALWHTAASAYAAAFALPSHRAAVVATATVAVIISLFPQDQPAVFLWHEAAAPYATAVTLGLPLLFAALVAGRRRWAGGAK